MGITKISNDLLYDEMFKGMTIVNGTTHEVRTIEKIINNTYIKIIESWGLCYPSLVCACVCWHTISYECILKNVKILSNCSGRYSTILSDIVVVYYLTIGLCCYLKKTMKSIKTSH